MGLPYLAAIRFLGSNRPEEFVQEIQKASDAVKTDVGTDRLFSLVANRTKDVSGAKTIVPLIPAIESTVASRRLGYVALETRTGEDQENWRFIPRYENPFWLEVEFDNALTSTKTSTRLIWSRLQQLVDKKVMDIAIGSEGYYGFAPLIYLLLRTRDVECSIETSGGFATDAGKLISELSAAFGGLEEVRKIGPQLVKARQVAAWTREWARNFARARS